jgi:hypothetical protein
MDGFVPRHDASLVMASAMNRHCERIAAIHLVIASEARQSMDRFVPR